MLITLQRARSVLSSSFSKANTARRARMHYRSSPVETAASKSKTRQALDGLDFTATFHSRGGHDDRATESEPKHELDRFCDGDRHPAEMKRYQRKTDRQITCSKTRRTPPGNRFNKWDPLSREQQLPRPVDLTQILAVVARIGMSTAIATSSAPAPGRGIYE